MTTEPKTQAESIDLLSERIDESGLSSRQFARRVLLREALTVRRWLSGERPIPKLVQEWLVQPEKAPWP